MKQRLLLCGGRDFTDFAFLEHHMGLVRPWCVARPLVIQGGARGADALAKRYAAAMGLPCAEVVALWSNYGNRAGSLRNEWMLELLMPDLVIAMPGGVGTAHMVRIAAKAGIDVYDTALAR